MKKKILIASTIVVTVILAISIHSIIPINVNKVYTGYIYSKENTFLKESSIVLKGTLNKWNHSFSGTIQIEDHTTPLEGITNLYISGGGIDHSKFHIIPKLGKKISEGRVMEALVVISKDFRIIYGYTPVLFEKYGKESYFKSQTDLKTIFD